MAMDYRDPNPRGQRTLEHPGQGDRRQRDGEDSRDTTTDFAASVPRRGNVRPAARHE